MKIGIIVYSHTGNTHSVALKLQEALAAAGHEVALERLETLGEFNPARPSAELGELPDITPYEALVLGSPVQAFSLAEASKRYLGQLGSLEGVPVALLVTEQFPYKWMGGNRAVRQMTRACQARGAQVLGSGIVNWSRKDREQRITDVVDGLSKLF